MAYGTARQCPIMFEPTDRKLGRASWKYLDHVCRLIWRRCGKAFEQGMVDLMIYGRATIPMVSYSQVDAQLRREGMV